LDWLRKASNQYPSWTKLMIESATIPIERKAGDQLGGYGRAS
jgi:hypothetical protein